MVSARLPSSIEANTVARALEAARAQGLAITDLTESNPTKVGLTYPVSLVESLADAAGLVYEPHPFGLSTARAAVAADQRRRGARVDPDDVILTSSTSEAYSWLFKLLCDPGDTVLIPRPSYPLFDHLTALEGIAAHPYALEYHGSWTTDVDMMAGAPARTRAVLVVSPNNPTGSYLKRDELARISQLCRERGWALVVDEVFADYPLDEGSALTDIAADSDVLTFSLAGLSKSTGMPQMKLAWITVGGPPPVRRAARASLELIADTYLSVATPVQIALPQLFDGGTAVRSQIQQRIRHNLDVLRSIAVKFPMCEVLRVEGGWSVVIRVPSIRPEEQLVLELLEQEKVLVHPGYFFDFPREAYVVVSLLPAPQVFADGVERLLTFASR